MGHGVIGSLRRAAYRRRRAALWTAAYCCAFDEPGDPREERR